MKGYFGKRPLRSIAHRDLASYKAHRLKTPIVVGRNTRGTNSDGNPQERERSIASVHRELSFLRRILKYHLKAIIICALDTGMRRGEMLKLKWSDIDLENGCITIQAFNTKTMRQREVGLTCRLSAELRRLSESADGELVFGIKTSVKTAFNNAKKKAGIPDLRFHDLRHTHATRLVAASRPLSEVGRMLGHTQPSTTYRYVNANADTAKRAADLLNKFNEAL